MAARSLNSLVSRGSFGPFYCEGQEILRRIFVTARDSRWQEIAPDPWDLVMDEGQRTVTVTARHTSECVDFEWRGTLEVRDDLRKVQFSFEGVARRDTDICRLGLVVLHPVQSLIGSRLTAKGPQGSERLLVAERIHPQPIVNGIPGAMLEPFSELTIERDDFGRLELSLGGDLFELEDQRNWGDASFKTYCTPLRMGFPRSIKAGTRVAHRVEAQFAPGVHLRRSRAKPPLPAEPHRFPTLGREWPELRDHHVQDDRAWGFLSVDLRGSDAAGRLRGLLEGSPPTTPFQISLEGESATSADLLALLALRRDRILRILLHGAGTALPPATLIGHWRQPIDAWGAAPAPALLAATLGYFVEFNRAVPLDARLNGMAFPLNPTVHSDDVATITDNVATIAEMAETARQLSGTSELAISPLALYYPPAEGLRRFPRELIAPWLAATLIHAALGRVTSVTLAADVLQGLHPSGTESARWLAWLNRCGGLEVTAFPIALPRDVHAAMFHSADRRATNLLAANLSTEAVVIPLEEMGLKDAALGRRELIVPPFGVAFPG